MCAFSCLWYFVVPGVLNPAQLKVRDIEIISQIEIAVGFSVHTLAQLLRVRLGEENQNAVWKNKPSRPISISGQENSMDSGSNKRCGRTVSIESACLFQKLNY